MKREIFKAFKNFLENYGYYFIPLFIGIFLLFIFKNVDLPKIKELFLLRNDLFKVQDRLNALKTKSDFLASFEEQKLDNDLEKINFVLPDGKDAPSILRTLEHAASVSGVFIKNLDLVPGKIATISAVSEKKDEIPVRVVTVANHSQLIDFLNQIENVGRFLNLRNMEINYSRESTTQAEIRLDLVAYFLVSSQKESFKTEDLLPELKEKEKRILEEVLVREPLLPISARPPVGKSDLFK